MLRRQAVFLVLALIEQQGLAIVAARFREKFGGEVADDAVVIRRGIEQPAREFLQAALGHVPDGLLVALVGIGPKAMGNVVNRDRLRGIAHCPRRVGEQHLLLFGAHQAEPLAWLRVVVALCTVVPMIGSASGAKVENSRLFVALGRLLRGSRFSA